MLYFFLDACATSRRYFEDIGSDIARQLFAYPGSTIIYDVIVVPETASTFTRVRNLGFFDEEKRLRLIASFRRESKEKHLVHPIENRHIELSVELIKRHDLHGADSIHLAVAILYARELRAAGKKDRVVFVTSDGQLYKAAVAEGLETIHLWTCRCSVCGNESIAKKGKLNRCEVCGRVCQVCEVAGCTNEHIVALSGLPAHSTGEGKDKRGVYSATPPNVRPDVEG